MRRTFPILFTILFLASCGRGAGQGTGPGLTSLTDAELNSPGAPPEAQTFDVNAKMIGFGRGEESKVLEAIDRIKRVIGSDEFKHQVLNYRFAGKKQFNDNNGLSNAQIYAKILEGSEMLTPGNDNTMDVELATYYDPSIVIGYTKPGIDTIFLNSKFLNAAGFEIADVAMNLMHEWLHKLGFQHDFQNTPGRASSVPYAIGYIMRTLASRL